MSNLLNESRMTVVEHFEELRNRVLYSIIIFICFTIITFIFVEPIVIFLQLPAHGIKFLQLAPGEYFFSAMKVSFYLGLLLSTPFIIYQLIMFISPGLTIAERRIIVPTILASVFLFICGLMFGYYFLIPAALNFLINYGANLVQPLWSFEQYFDFILALFVSTGFVFQIPIFQIICSVLRLVSSQHMISFWKYVLVISTIIGAILTPSTDPITQIVLSSAIVLLYCLGVLFMIIVEKIITFN
uniref:Sec-independent periplasmic protein translocase n=1 Tax=Rhodochaete parvula TaxID=110510 RepID=A0A1X9PV16_9RHOD|nr:sec-independent periplasmic protein translocase [Rhodochaete parvula]ASK39565.1 Sec-independent translocase component C [Rhodochaete parvula]